jgi:hypothetical protein
MLKQHVCKHSNGSDRRRCACMVTQQDYLQSSLRVLLLDGFGQKMLGNVGPVSCTMSFANAADSVRASQVEPETGSCGRAEERMGGALCGLRSRCVQLCCVVLCCAALQAYTVKGGVAVLDNGTAVFSAAQVVALRLQYFPMAFVCDAPKIGTIPLYNPASVEVQVGEELQGACLLCGRVNAEWSVLSGPCMDVDAVVHCRQVPPCGVNNEPGQDGVSCDKCPENTVSPSECRWLQCAEVAVSGLVISSDSTVAVSVLWTLLSLRLSLHLHSGHAVRVRQDVLLGHHPGHGVP